MTDHSVVVHGANEDFVTTHLDAQPSRLSAGLDLTDALGNEMKGRDFVGEMRYHSIFQCFVIN